MELLNEEQSDADITTLPGNNIEKSIQPLSLKLITTIIPKTGEKMDKQYF